MHTPDKVRDKVEKVFIALKHALNPNDYNNLNFILLMVEPTKAGKAEVACMTNLEVDQAILALREAMENLETNQKPREGEIN